MAVVDIDVKWDGFEELIALYDALSEILRVEVDKTMHTIAVDATRFMETNTPFRTGYLRSRTQFDMLPLGFRVFNDTDYAGFVEWGTRYMPANPYLAPTVYYVRQEMKRLLPKVSITTTVSKGWRRRA